MNSTARQLIEFYQRDAEKGRFIEENSGKTEEKQRTAYVWSRTGSVLTHEDLYKTGLSCREAGELMERLIEAGFVKWVTYESYDKDVMH